MFEYCIDPSVDEPIMLILKQIGNTYDEQGNVTEWGVQGADFLKELLLLDNMGKSRIQIWINSVGGSVVDGYSILGGMLKTKTKVDTHNIGVAASTAGWLFAAGRNRDMCDYATWMGHNPSSPTGEDSEILNKFRESIVNIISARCNMSVEDTAAMLDKETYLTASEAFAIGLCDSISATSKQNIKRMSSVSSLQDKYKEALQITNSIIPNKKTVMDNKIDVRITNKLGIDAAASPEMVLNSIIGYQDKIIVLESNASEAAKALEVANKAKSDLQKRFDDLSKEMNDLKCEMEAEEVLNRTKAATDMVNSFVELGKIANVKTEVDGWIADAAASKDAFDKIKNRLTALPVNKAANKLEVVTKLEGAGGVKNAATMMHEIAKKNAQKK